MSNYNASDVQTAATVAQEVQKERESGIIDYNYIKGLPAVMKGLEVVLTLIAYICVETSNVICIRLDKAEAGELHSTTFRYFEFVTMAAFASVLVLYGIRLFKLHTRCFRCDCVNWPLVELVYYGTVIVFLIFADLFLSIHSCHSSHKAGVAFGWFALVAFAVDLVFAFMEFRRSRQAPAEQSTPQYDADRY